jgi:hypothetical protein
MFRSFIFMLIMSVSFQAMAATELQKKMVRFIDSVAGVYDSMYAPALWKKEFANWTLAASVSEAKSDVLAKEMTLSEYHKVINKLILSMKDYHVSMTFFATEQATLPLTIRGVDGRYFIVFIDREKLPTASFPFKLGDEVLEMGGEKVHDIVTKLKATLGENTNETDQALAEMMLTRRRASRAQEVTQGPITMKFKSGDKEVEHQLIWDYTKELITQNTKDFTKDFGSSEPLAKRIKLEMASHFAMDIAKDMKADNPFGLGTKKSFLPELGTKIWSSSKESHHDAYIYLNDKKELIGYVRIPSYGAGEKESKEFVEIMKKFSKTTDKLVIDQLNNPGGSVFYLYSLVSMLTDKAVSTPKHYMAINQASVKSDFDALKELESVKDLAGLKKAMGAETISGYPLSMTFLQFMKSYYQFKIDEWNAGKKLTSPYHIYGVDKINPHPEVQYNKPILLLVNELDFSGGDFFPAIMQDNKRATIMGVRTAGAGGYVIGVEIPNQLGIDGFRYTGSLADRVDNTPIENLGVKPEVDYSLTVEDFQKNFKPFADKINEEINKL